MWHGCERPGPMSIVAHYTLSSNKEQPRRVCKTQRRAGRVIPSGSNVAGKVLVRRSALECHGHGAIPAGRTCSGRNRQSLPAEPPPTSLPGPRNGEHHARTEIPVALSPVRWRQRGPYERQSYIAEPLINSPMTCFLYCRKASTRSTVPTQSPHWKLSGCHWESASILWTSGGGARRATLPNS